MKAKHTTLDNGLTIMTVEMPDSPTATVMVFVRAGEKYETAEINGISHFLEHMCFKGTQKYSQKDLSLMFDQMGVINNAFTSNEITGYYTKGRTKHWRRCAQLLADIYSHSTFPEGEIEKERGVILGEIDMKMDQPMRQMHADWMALLYGDQPGGRPVLGPKKNIRAFRREHFVNYHQDHYVAGKTVVVVAGSVKHRDVVSEVKMQFAGIATGKNINKKRIQESQKKPALFVRSRKTDQAHVAVGVRTVGLNHRDMYALEILGVILGSGMSSRLFQRLREEMGAGYYAYANAMHWTDHGFLVARTGTRHDRVGEVIDAILDEMRDIRDNGVTEKELKKAKEYAISTSTMRLESSDEWAEYYGVQYCVQGKMHTFREYTARLKDVSVRDIQRVAKKYFTKDRLNVAIIGDVRKSKKLESLLRF